MKLLALILSAFQLFSLSAFSADVVVTSATSVTIDGVASGKPCDAIANNPQLASAIQIALEQWAAKITAEKADVAAEHAALKSRISTVLNGMLTEELKTGEGPRTALLRKLIDEAGKSDADLKREALAAEIAAKQKELQSLTP